MAGLLARYEAQPPMYQRVARVSQRRIRGWGWNNPGYGYALSGLRFTGCGTACLLERSEAQLPPHQTQTATHEKSQPSGWLLRGAGRLSAGPARLACRTGRAV